MKRGESGSPPLRPRGRPRAFDRDVALEKAMQVFWRQGYEATSLYDLTQAMGINPPSLYATFGNKERLFYETIARYRSGFGNIVARQFHQEPTARAAVELFMNKIARELTATTHPPGCMIVSTALSCSDAAAKVQKKLSKYRLQGLAMIQSRIEQGISDGDVPEGTDAGRLAHFFMTVVHGMTVQARDGASGEELKSTVQIAMQSWPKARVLKKTKGAAPAA